MDRGRGAAVAIYRGAYGRFAGIRIQQLLYIAVYN